MIYLVPMINPDGVVCGNYRTSLSGSDLNRKWVDPDTQLYPEVMAVKEFLAMVNIFIDLHGHSKKEYAFMYGNAINRNDSKFL